MNCIVTRPDGLRQTCPDCSLELPVYEELLKSKKALESAAFPDFDAAVARQHQMKASLQAGTAEEAGWIQVSVLDGRSAKLMLTRTTPLRQVQASLAAQLEVPVAMQRLLFFGRSLTEGIEARKCVWGDLEVPFGSTVQLVIQMYHQQVPDKVPGKEAASGVKRLRFELQWQAIDPRGRKPGQPFIHHLNGSCIILSERCRHLGTVDFLRQEWGSISHWGKSSRRRPWQVLSVDLEELPEECCFLFFTLSGFAPAGLTLQVFQNPLVKLLDGDTEVELARYEAHRARAAEAVILCCVKLDPLCGWRVLAIGRESAGNYRQYGPLLKAVNLLAQGPL